MVLAGVNGLAGMSMDVDEILSGFLTIPGRPVAIALDSLSAVARFFARVHWGRWPVAWLNVLLVTGAVLLLVQGIVRISRPNVRLFNRLGASLLILGLVYLPPHLNF